ncbi:putative pyruvate dehydrogenase [Mycolicibacterium insubricum]|mgnify:CR=1 FL=1|jgi:pyruvate dehydrogenase (quinone)|uniref:Pyruvate oxidase n=1 Tax=Mycolicibacterium insubricum TaxID=444597 RepID=A0A1X0DII3_9MYCO|nr:ubiquinone-dependent pyruvate dehydrogenase [Mycolicibacterium insubricum]MCB9440013.1 ubiquinone-dependent pyruvate dehydrogenase [Mycolicibacterium sp.]MCV7080512.1 ubiquinone-dependent pyruvate dehydrogenase [Mycolicibacterium insubricum]ORA72213.1 pyruvate oxidase [Mycolicibacterium insubricum]BBZ66558.1 putative pyruvate dehydrogenase [Mycolicibacterium insubricum]
MARTVSQLILDTVKAAGVQRIYGLPGDSLNALTDALRGDGSLAWVHVRHEEAAAFAAGAEAALTGNLAVCVASCGPGNLHLINGLFDAQRSRVPVLAIASHIPGAEIGSGYFQETHPQNLFAECSVYSELVSSVDQLPYLLDIAVRAALDQRGVAVLTIPGEILAARTDIPAPAEPITAGIGIRLPDTAGLRRAAELLDSARAVTILAGAGCQGAHAELLAVAGLLQAPVVHTMRGKEFVEYDNPFDVGMTGLLGFRSGYQAMEDADVLLMLGTDFPYRQFYPTGAKIIQVDIRGEHIGRRARVDVALVGSVKDTLTQLGSTLRQHTDTHHLDASRGTYARTRAQLDSLATGDRNRTPVLPEFLTRRIDALSADDAVFIADVGTPVIWAARYLTMNGHRRLLGSFNHGSMANAVPQAIGAQASHPGRQVVTLSGDGGLSMMLGDLLTLTQSELPVKMIVFNNGALSFVEIEMKAAGIVNFGTGLDNPVFADVAQAMGIHADRVERPSEIDGALSAAFAHPGPALVEVLTARQELSIPPTINAAQVAGFSLWATKTLLSGRGDELIDLAKTNLGARLHRRKPQ